MQEQDVALHPAIIKLRDFMTEAGVNFNAAAELTPELLQARRNRILEFEEVVKQLPQSYDMDQFNEGKVQHFFASGVYGRELFIPAGNVIASKIHKGKTLNCIAMGKISVICPHKGLNVYQGPFTFVSEEMTKRIVIAHEDTLWITSHENPTNTEDLEEIETLITAKDFKETL